MIKVLSQSQENLQNNEWPIPGVKTSATYLMYRKPSALYFLSPFFELCGFSSRRRPRFFARSASLDYSLSELLKFQRLKLLLSIILYLQTCTHLPLGLITWQKFEALKALNILHIVMKNCLQGKETCCCIKQDMYNGTPQCFMVAYAIEKSY